MQALMWALQAYMDVDQARLAAALWQPPADGQASAMAGLSRYCRLVGLRFGLQGREAELHLRIIRAMQAQARAARPLGWPPGPRTEPELPLRQMEPALSANDSVPPSGPAGALVVQRFIERVEQALAREAPADYSAQRWRQSVLRQARQVPPLGLQQLNDWLWGRSVHLAGDWPPRGAGTRLVNTVYVALAQWLGPVKADACFTAIVREFEREGDAHLSVIRSYL